MSKIKGFRINNENVRYQDENIAPEYSTTSTYASGNYVMYEGQLYKNNTAVTSAGSWASNSSKFSLTTVGENLNLLRTDLDILNAGGLVIEEELVKDEIDAWLSANPSYTTTVLDNSLTTVKYQNNSVTKEKLDTTVQSTLNSIDEINNRSLKNIPLTIRRFGRLLDATYLTGEDQVLYGQNVTYYDGKYYSSGAYNSNANQVVSVWNSNGEFINAEAFTTLGHCNGMTATEDYLLVAAGNSATINILNRDDLSFNRSISITGVRNVTGINTDGDEIYFFGMHPSNYSRNIYKLNLEDDTYEYLANFPTPVSGSPQNFCVHDGYAYMLYVQGNRIFKFSIADEVIECIYDIPDGDGWNPCGECESLFIKDGDICLQSVLYYRNSNSSPYSTTIALLFKTSILSSVDNTFVTSYMFPQTKFEFGVNKNATYEFNPSTSFTTIEEACHVLNYLKQGAVTITANAIEHGYIQLIGGVYSIRSGGSSKVDNVDIYNSVVNLWQLGIGNLNIIRSNVNIAASYFYNGIVFIDRARVNFNRTDCSLVTSITNIRSLLFFVLNTAAFPADLTINNGENISIEISIKDMYKQYCLKPVLFTTAASNTRILLLIFTGVKSYSMVLTGTEINNGISKTIDDNTTIVLTNDMKIKINDTELTANDMIMAEIIRIG